MNLQLWDGVPGTMPQEVHAALFDAMNRRALAPWLFASVRSGSDLKIAELASVGLFLVGGGTMPLAARGACGELANTAGRSRQSAC